MPIHKLPKSHSGSSRTARTARSTKALSRSDVHPRQVVVVTVTGPLSQRPAALQSNEGNAQTRTISTCPSAGMAKIPNLEREVHGRERDLTNEDELRFGVYDELLYARNVPGIQGAQWTGIVTQVAISMLESGRVDAVVCVQSDDNDRWVEAPAVRAPMRNA
jgi:coenzyme F420-reducing hydrogenase beta subunit